MMPSRVTHRQLVGLLLGLGFTDEPLEDRWRSFRHEDSGTIIILPDRLPNIFVRDAELASARRHLVANGLVEEGMFAEFLEHGHLPQPR